MRRVCQSGAKLQHGKRAHPEVIPGWTAVRPEKFLSNRMGAFLRLLAATRRYRHRRFDAGF
jgi:hypothetical protein